MSLRLCFLQARFEIFASPVPEWSFCRKNLNILINRFDDVIHPEYTPEPEQISPFGLDRMFEGRESFEGIIGMGQRSIPLVPRFLALSQQFYFIWYTDAKNLSPGSTCLCSSLPFFLSTYMRHYGCQYSTHDIVRSTCFIVLIVSYWDNILRRLGLHAHKPAQHVLARHGIGYDGHHCHFHTNH